MLNSPQRRHLPFPLPSTPYITALSQLSPKNVEFKQFYASYCQRTAARKKSNKNNSNNRNNNSNANSYGLKSQHPQCTVLFPLIGPFVRIQCCWFTMEGS